MKKNIFRTSLFAIVFTLSIGVKAQDPYYRKTQVRTMNGLKWAYVDERTGNRIIEPKYDEAQDFYDGILIEA